MENEDKKWRVNSLAKALRILDCFDTTRSEMSLAQLSEMVGLPKSTAFNLIKTLMEAGFVKRAPYSSNYMLGLKLFEMGYRVRSSLGIVSVAIPLMEEIMGALGEITYLSAVHGDHTIILEGVYPEKRFYAYSLAGKTLPLYCCSAGKAMLSRMPGDIVTQILEDCGMPARTPNTITNIEQMKAELLVIRQRGYSVDNEEETLGSRAVSVPIRNAKGWAVGTISISGSVHSMTEDKINSSVPLLDKAGQILSQKAELFPAIYYGLGEQ